MNFVLKRKVLGSAVVAGLFVASWATLPAKGEPVVDESNLVGSYSGDFYASPRAKLATRTELTITEVVNHHIKGTLLLIPGISVKASGSCPNNKAPIEGTVQDNHLSLAVPADDKYCAGTKLDLVLKEGQLEGTLNSDVRLVLMKK